MNYKQRFRAGCCEDGLNLYVADALSRLRRGTSKAGFKRMLDNIVARNKDRAEARQKSTGG